MVVVPPSLLISNSERIQHFHKDLHYLGALLGEWFLIGLWIEIMLGIPNTDVMLMESKITTFSHPWWPQALLAPKKTITTKRYGGQCCFVNCQVKGSFLTRRFIFHTKTFQISWYLADGLCPSSPHFVSLLLLLLSLMLDLKWIFGNEASCLQWHCYTRQHHHHNTNSNLYSHLSYKIQPHQSSVALCRLGRMDEHSLFRSPCQ